jgi:hypothetical protein
MGATKDSMIEEAEREREEEYQKAVKESPIGEAEECAHCGSYFPLSEADEEALCADCLEEEMSKN